MFARACCASLTRYSLAREDMDWCRRGRILMTTVCSNRIAAFTSIPTLNVRILRHHHSRSARLVPQLDSTVKVYKDSHQHGWSILKQLDAVHLACGLLDAAFSTEHDPRFDMPPYAPVHIFPLPRCVWSYLYSRCGCTLFCCTSDQLVTVIRLHSYLTFLLRPLAHWFVEPTSSTIVLCI
jgi:hypothetical protein